MITRMRQLFFLLIMILMMLTTSCGKQKKKEDNIDEYIQKTKQKLIIQTPTEYTVPKIDKAYFHTNNQRNPFENPFIKKLKKSYPDAILKEHSIDSLRMVGIINHGKKIWGILTTPDGKKYKVTIGMRVGVNNALVKKITEHEMILEDQSGSEQGQNPVEITLPIKTPK